MTSFEGGCLCGAVRYRGTEQKGAGHCYCDDCRKSSGTGHSTHMTVPKSTISVSGEVRFFEKPADSGHIVARGFCPNCGSVLYTKNSATPDLIILRASSLDDPEAVTPEMVVYAKRALSWDKPDPALPAYDEMPPVAEIAKVE